MSTREDVPLKPLDLCPREDAAARFATAGGYMAPVPTSTAVNVVEGAVTIPPAVEECPR